MPSSVVAAVRAAVGRFLDERALPSDAAIVAAVSGGQDSICLLDALAAIRAGRGLRIVAGHVDHRLRGEESRGEALAVRAVAEGLGVESVVASVDVPVYAARHRLGLEESARIVRYQALATIADRIGATTVATGHTLDDAAEGLLLNLLRGAGSHGLRGIEADKALSPQLLGPIAPELCAEGSGMPPVRVLRPILTIARSTTAAYCRERGLPFRSDPTNRDPSFTRNRIRLHLIPLLRTYNPSVVDALAHLARIVADDDDALEAQTEEVWRSAAQPGQSGIRFLWSSWQLLAPSIQRRLLRRAGRELGMAPGWSYQAVEDARRILGGRAAGRRLSLGAGIGLMTSRSGFTVSRDAASGLETEPEGG